MVQGPAWSRPGLDVVSARYPLRVETHVLRLVARLLPGVITTTPHARVYALHGLVWSEAARRGLDFDAACDLLRRCEVVVAGVSLQHQHAVEQVLQIRFALRIAVRQSEERVQN